MSGDASASAVDFDSKILERQQPEAVTLDGVSLSLPSSSLSAEVTRSAPSAASSSQSLPVSAPAREVAIGHLLQTIRVINSDGDPVLALMGVCVSGNEVFASSAQGVFVSSLSSGKQLRQWGSAFTMKRPNQVCVSKGECYLSDTGNSRIQVYDAQAGADRRSITHASLENPRGLVLCESKKEIYVCSLISDEIIVFNAKSGELLRRWGKSGKGDGQLNSPNQLALSNGTLYVCESQNHRIQCFNAATGKYLRKFGSEGSGDGQLKEPCGVAVSGSRVFVCDTSNHRICEFTHRSVFVRSFGYEGQGGRLLKFPCHCFVTGDESDRLVVADGGNSTLRLFNIGKSQPETEAETLDDTSDVGGSLQPSNTTKVDKPPQSCCSLQ